MSPFRAGSASLAQRLPWDERACATSPIISSRPVSMGRPVDISRRPVADGRRAVVRLLLEVLRMRFDALDCCRLVRGREVTEHSVADIKASYAACDAQALHRYRRRTVPFGFNTLESELLFWHRHRCRAEGFSTRLSSEGARTSTTKLRGSARGHYEFINAIALIP